ncbi:MAG: hypothetical protein WBC44_12730 [Planctomycetaceae bacterium]
MKFSADNVVRLIVIFCATVPAGCGSETPSPTAAETAETDKPFVTEPATSSPSASNSGAFLPVVDPDLAASATPSPLELQPVYRPDDERLAHDAAALERVGIRRFESKRLILYTDLAADEATELPSFVDALYDELVDYFGELPPARDGSEFQITGYLMVDGDRFRSAGLLPDDLPPFQHGRHRGRRFWMRDQEYDYYRRHLLLHEATHCFMTLLPGSVGPDWYMEGMAELFGTHQVADDGVRFRVMPISPEATAGSGRITLVRQDVAADGFKTLDDVFALKPGEFLENNAYAWSWAACYFLDTHPRYRDRFRGLGEPSLRRRLTAEYVERFDGAAAEIAIDWAMFAHTLRYGYDLEAAAIVFGTGEPLPVEGATVGIEAARGWQSSGIHVQAGKRYRIAAEGRFTLADEPVPWISDAGGIGFDYFDGRPLGRLLAAVVSDDRSSAPDPAGGLLNPIEIGRESTIDAPTDGTLYLRINDHWNRLDDNRGELRVMIQSIAE